MNTAIMQLKKDVCSKATEGREVRRQIQALTWKEGSASEVQAIQSQRDESGRRVMGKRALKAFRRPETGDQRAALWSEKRSIGYSARTALLTYGMLRGRAYLTIESKCAPGNEPSSYAILRMLKGILPEGKEVPESVIKEWLKGGPAPVIFEEQAA